MSRDQFNDVVRHGNTAMAVNWARRCGVSMTQIELWINTKDEHHN